jgi:hypothetical protein
MEKFRIIQRHEWYSSSGIIWSKWYQALSEMADNEEDLKPRLDECEKKGQELFKTTKMKIEYKIDKFDFVPMDFSDLKNVPKALKERKKTRKK